MSYLGTIKAISLDGDGTLWDFDKVMRHSLRCAWRELERLDPQAAARLKEALEMSPSDADAHLNLAVVMRRALRMPAPAPGVDQRRRLESERHIAIAAVLTRWDPSRPFQVHGPVDDEARYALGRAEQYRGRLGEAKDILSKLPQDHEDAQEALREIAEQEKAPAPRPAAGGRQE